MYSLDLPLLHVNLKSNRRYGTHSHTKNQIENNNHQQQRLDCSIANHLNWLAVRSKSKADDGKRARKSREKKGIGKKCAYAFHRCVPS